jgi:hypothetical protein
VNDESFDLAALDRCQRVRQSWAVGHTKPARKPFVRANSDDLVPVPVGPDVVVPV